MYSGKDLKCKRCVLPLCCFHVLASVSKSDCFMLASNLASLETEGPFQNKYCFQGLMTPFSYVGQDALGYCIVTNNSKITQEHLLSPSSTAPAPLVGLGCRADEKRQEKSLGWPIVSDLSMEAVASLTSLFWMVMSHCWPQWGFSRGPCRASPYMASWSGELASHGHSQLLMGSKV